MRGERLVQEFYCEESRDVALVVVHVFELFTFNICCMRVKHINSCNYLVYSWIHSRHVY